MRRFDNVISERVALPALHTHGANDVVEEPKSLPYWAGSGPFPSRCVLIDIKSERTFPLPYAARHVLCLQVRRNGKPVSPATLWRWASRGLKGVRLETIKIAGQTCTSDAAIDRFLSAFVKAEDQPAFAPRRAVSRHAAVEAELAARGI